MFQTLALATPDPIGNYSFSTGNRSPAKAGVQMAQRCPVWTPAFAGAPALTCLMDMYADPIRGKQTRAVRARSGLPRRLRLLAMTHSVYPSP